ncbi:MAG: T9SS type A sorting domain-containing protein, partial [Bacteroidia bacterium]
TTEISEYSNLNTQVAIYPNPSNGVFNLKMNEPENLKNLDLKVYNILGECIFQLINQRIGTSNLQIDLTNQVNGLYLIKIMNGHEMVANLKIIKD